MQPFFTLADRVREASKGELVLEWRGGPETIAALDQFDALKLGVADLSINVSDTRFVPESDVFQVSRLSPTQEREVGFYDFMVGRWAEKGLFYLGRAASGGAASGNYYNWTNAKITKIEDFAGLKFRAHPIYVPMHKALGITSVVMPMGDIYTAMDTRMVDGFTISAATTLKNKWYEVTKYVVFPGFWTYDSLLLMSLRSWDRLPKHLQDLLVDVIVKWEPEMVTYHVALEKDSFKGLLDKGMIKIEFTGADATRYLETVSASKWEAVKGAVSLWLYNKYREMVAKAK